MTAAEHRARVVDVAKDWATDTDLSHDPASLETLRLAVMELLVAELEEKAVTAADKPERVRCAICDSPEPHTSTLECCANLRAQASADR